MVRSLVAFANTAGGILIVGVEDDGSIVGLAEAQGEEERLSNLIADSIRPVLQPDIEVAQTGGVNLLVVRVARLPGPFYVAQDGPDTGVFVRVGSTNRRASRETVETLRREAERLSSTSGLAAEPSRKTWTRKGSDKRSRPLGAVPMRAHSCPQAFSRWRAAAGYRPTEG